MLEGRDAEARSFEALAAPSRSDEATVLKRGSAVHETAPDLLRRHQPGRLHRPSDGSVDWLDRFAEGGNDHGYSGFYQGIDGLLMGRGTCDIVRFGDWPYPGKAPPGAHPQSRESAVEGVELRHDTPRGGLAPRRTGLPAGAWLAGGGSLAGSCLAAGLLDEVIVSVIPQLLGAGIPLFAGGASGACTAAGTTWLQQRHRADALPGDRRGRPAMTDNLLSISAACPVRRPGQPVAGAQARRRPSCSRAASASRRNAPRRATARTAGGTAPAVGASTFEHLGGFQAPAANESEHPRRCRYLRRPPAPRRLCARRAGGTGLAGPRPAQPDNLAPLLRDHVPAGLARRAAKTGSQAEHRTRPIMCASACATVNEKGLGWPFRVLAPIARNIGG